MQILLLGYGKEGKSSEAYFQNHGDEITILDSFTPSDLTKIDTSKYDLVLRSPSVRPHPGWSSITKYFFDHCPCPIIGVTGTKGKGTTCSIITTVFQSLGKKVWLVGNIGNPALDILDKVQPTDIVVYEMSSFQLWDLEKSPHVAVVLRVEPDHLNVHKDFAEYVAAKTNIVAHQTAHDYCIYNQQNITSTEIAQHSIGQKIAYPTTQKSQLLSDTLTALNVPGQHNRENTEAALLAIAAYYDQNLDELLQNHGEKIKTALASFQGLPHRLEFIRELNQVKYYDDNFSASFPALDVAIAAFSDQPIVLIAGGQDRGLDLTPTKHRIFDTPNVRKVFLIGETSSKLANGEDQNRYAIYNSFTDAFKAARRYAEDIAHQENQTVILLMSPGAPSFDMFKNFTERGQQFQDLVWGVE